MSREEAAKGIRQAEIKQIIVTVYWAAVMFQTLRSAFCILNFLFVTTASYGIIMDEGAWAQKGPTLHSK